MSAFLLSLISDILAGLVVWSLTEGPRTATDQSFIVFDRSIVQFNFFGGEVTDGGDWDPLACLAILGALILMVLVAVVWITAMYVQWMDVLLSVGFWGVVGLAACSLLLGALGYWRQPQRDVRMSRLALYTMLLCVGFAGLGWLIYAAPFAPPDYWEVYAELRALDLAATDWESTALAILFAHPRAIRFLLLQVAGLLPGGVSAALVAYTQVNLAIALVLDRRRDIPVWVLYGAFGSALVASLLLGLVPMG